MSPAKTALLLVDIQYDFLPLPGSTLGVEDGTAVVPIVTRMLEMDDWPWDIVAASQDWHPQNHISFAFNNNNAELFKEKEVPSKNGQTVMQMMWPDHCIQGSKGADLEASIVNALKPWQAAGKSRTFQKASTLARTRYKAGQMGTDPLVDAYSSFASDASPTPDPAKGEHSPLATYLRAEGIKRTVCVGIATDVCVRATALAALNWAFETIMVPEGMRSVGGKEAEERTYREVTEKGGKVVNLEELKEILGW